jgi:membrane-associated phospholipid phosphatase
VAYDLGMAGRSPSRTRVAVALGLAFPLVVFAYLATAIVRTGHLAWDAGVASITVRVLSTNPRPFGGTSLLNHATLEGLVVFASVAAVLLVRRHAREAVFWITAVGSVFALDPLLKALFERPGVGGDYSFPSGSALFGAVAVAASASMMPTRRLRLATAVPGTAICLVYGAALVTADWHYPSDVLGGWAFGLAWATGMWLVFFGRPWSASALRNRSRTPERV